MFSKSKLVSALALTATLCGGASAAPVLWAGDGSGKLGTVDVATGTSTVVGQMSQVMTDLAFDASGNLWGITFNSLYSINKNTAATTLVGSFGPSLNSLVFGADGSLYAAGNSLYKLSTANGAATLIGTGGGYTSAGDLAFINGSLYLSSLGYGSDNLFELNTSTGAGTVVGSIGFSGVYGLATDNNVNLYGVSGTNILGINTSTGAATVLSNYAGSSALSAAWGSAFYSEGGAVSAVPEPETYALLLAGLGLMGAVARRRKAKQA